MIENTAEGETIHVLGGTPEIVPEASAAQKTLAALQSNRTRDV